MKTTLLSLKNQYWKKIKEGDEMISKLLTNALPNYITELNELIYAGAKLNKKKFGVSLRNPNRKKKHEI